MPSPKTSRAARLIHWATRSLRGRALLLLARAWPARRRPRGRHHGMRILLVVVGGLGDSLLFDPVFRRLREVWGDVRIDVLTAGFDALWRRLESVDGVLYVRPPGPPSLRSWARLVRRIRRRHYDVAIEALPMLPGTGVWHVLAALALDASRAPIRVGRRGTGKLFLWLGDPARQAERERWRPGAAPRNRHVTHRVREPDDRLVLFAPERVLEAVGIRGPLPAPVLRGDPEPDRWAHRLVRTQWAGPGDLVVGVVLEVTYELKRWPPERYAALIARGVADGLRFVVLGQETRHARLLSGFPADRVLDLTGLTDLAQLLAVVGECDAFVGSDSGPAHVAQAHGVPSVVLFGPSSERQYGPTDRTRHDVVTPRADLPCRPCGKGPCVREQSCMHLISVEEVYARLHARVTELAGTPRRRTPPAARTRPLRVRYDSRPIDRRATAVRHPRLGATGA